MRAIIVFFLLGVCILLMETTWGGFFRYDYLQFHGLPALLVWYGLGKSSLYAFVPVLVLGVVSAPFSSLPVWMITASFLISFILVQYVSRNVFLGMTWQRSILVMCVGFVGETFAMTMSGVPELVWPWGGAQALLDAAASPFLFALFDRVGSMMPGGDRGR